MITRTIGGTTDEDVVSVEMESTELPNLSYAVRSDKGSRRDAAPSERAPTDHAVAPAPEERHAAPYPKACSRQLSPAASAREEPRLNAVELDVHSLHVNAPRRSQGSTPSCAPRLLVTAWTMSSAEAPRLTRTMSGSSSRGAAPATTTGMAARRPLVRRRSSTSATG